MFHRQRRPPRRNADADLRDTREQPVGIDIKPSPFTNQVGSVTDREFVRESLRGVDAVDHAATLHKPHIATHTRQNFVDTNISGTLTLLEEAVRTGVSRFIYTSTTSVFGRALVPRPESRRRGSPKR